MPRRSQWHLRYRKSDKEIGLPKKICDEESAKFKVCDHSCAQIFSVGQGSEDYSKKRTIITDAQEIQYELLKGYNQKPETPSDKRFNVQNVNVQASPLFVRMRVWILKFAVWAIIVGYLVLFVIVNLIFAILWYLAEDKCCGDSSMNFADTLNFAIQTSTTLGYGGNEPEGLYSNILVTLNFFVSLTLHALFAGVIFLKFVTPSAKIEFSKIMTLSNVNGLPCLEIRVGNADGSNMILQDLTARLNFMYVIRYNDDEGKPREMRSMQDINLLVNWRYELKEVWTLRHVIDEKSPLFGVLGIKGLQEDIQLFRVTVSGVQDVTKMHVASSRVYHLQDILIGYRFQDQLGWDPEKNELIVDYSKMNEAVPHPVWYPVQDHAVVTTIDENESEEGPTKVASSERRRSMFEDV